MLSIIIFYFMNSMNFLMEKKLKRIFKIMDRRIEIVHTSYLTYLWRILECLFLDMQTRTYSNSVFEGNNTIQSYNKIRCTED